MKKNLFVILIFAAVLAVGLSGCLGGGDDVNNTTNNSTDNALNNSTNYSINNTNNISNNSSNSSNGSKPVPVFDANLTLVDPIPNGFTFLSTTTVKSHGQHVGITDALYGYQGIYHYGKNETPVFLTYYDVAIANTTKTPDSYIQMMKDNHKKQYGSDSNVSTVQINEHDATLLAAETDEVPQYGRYILAWPLGDTLLVTVAGNVEYSALESLATATGY